MRLEIRSDDWFKHVAFYGPLATIERSRDTQTYLAEQLKKLSPQTVSELNARLSEIPRREYQVCGVPYVDSNRVFVDVTGSPNKVLIATLAA